MSDMSDRERSRSPSRSPRRERSRSRSQSPRQARDIEEDDKRIKAFVGGLPWKIEDPDLREIFAEFDPDECLVMKDKFNGKSRGFGFVYFKDEASREDAISKIHDMEIEGRRISVRAAVPRSEMPSKPRRGRGGPRRDFGRPRYDDRRGGYERRGGYDDRRGGYDDRRGGYDDRRGGYDDRRGGYDDRRGGYDDRRGGYDDRRRRYDERDSYRRNDDYRYY